MAAVIKLAVAALCGAAATALVLLRPRAHAHAQLDCAKLSVCFGGFAGQFASPGIDA